jgi:hypothetical protein
MRATDEERGEWMRLLSKPLLRCLIASASILGCVGGLDLEEDAEGPSLGAIEERLSSVTSSTVITSQMPTDDVARRIVRLSNLAFTAGKKMYFYGKYEATSDTTASVLMGARIVCSRGVTQAPSVYSTCNHEGSDEGKRTIALRWLLVVPETGTYTCDLTGRANKTEGEATLTIVAGPNTAIIMEDGPVFGAAQWIDPGLEDIPNGSSAYVLRKTWTATQNAHTIDVDADVEVTTKGTYSIVTTNLFATQVGPSGAGCAPPVSVARTMTVYAATRHLKFYHSLRDVPISTDWSCTRNFGLKVRVGVSAGDAIRVEGTDPPDTNSYSNGIAIPRP